MPQYVEPLLGMNRQYLDDTRTGTPMGEHPVAILGRALANGGEVSRTDYERAWAAYRQCIVDKGWPAPPVYRIGEYYGTRLDYYAPKEWEERDRKLKSDIADCCNRELVNVDDVYKRQHVNLGLYAQPEAATVDCLHRAGLVPASYTVEEYRRQKSAFLEYWDASQAGHAPAVADTTGHFSIDLGNTEVVSCIACNNDTLVDMLRDYDAPEWFPFGQEARGES